MRPASPAAVVLVAAFVVAAGALTFLALRIAGSERNAVEQELRRRLRASVESEAQRIRTRLAIWQERALTGEAEAVVKDGAIVEPVPPLPLLHLCDSGGSDRIGDSMLSEAERLEVAAGRVGEAESIYRRLAAATSNAVPTTLADRKLATWRLAALLARGGRADEAAAVRATFLALLEGEERATIEGLFARLASDTRSETESEELRRDLMARVGGAADEVVVGMLRETGGFDESALTRRQAEVAQIDGLRTLLPELLRRPAGAAFDAERQLMAWTRAANGTQRVIRFDFGSPELPAGYDGFYNIVRMFDPHAPRIVAPPWIRDEAGSREPDDLFEQVNLSDVVPDVSVVASAPRSEVDAETRRRVRWITGALATLLLIGGVAVYWTLRAARREREAALARTGFVARVSHDLRTPLSVIRMYAETIASGRAEEPAQVREFAGVAAREAERLTALVGQILDFSRATMMKAGAPAGAADESIDVGALLTEVVEELRGAARAAGMELALAVNGNDLRVRGDRAGLKAALVNLVTNALLHASSGGRAEIEAHAGASDVEIRVSDRGPGLPRELGQRIFEPFVRGPQARPGGSGLGLALVREVAARHGGRALAEERVGGGAVFTFAIPRQQSSARDVEPPPLAPDVEPPIVERPS